MNCNSKENENEQLANLRLYQRHINSINLNQGSNAKISGGLLETHGNYNIQNNQVTSGKYDRCEKKSQIVKNNKFFNHHMDKLTVNRHTPKNNTDYVWQQHNHELYCRPGYRNDEYDTRNDSFFDRGYTIPTKVNTRSNISNYGINPNAGYYQECNSMGRGGADRIVDESRLQQGELTGAKSINGSATERPINRFQNLFRDYQRVENVVQDWPRGGVDTRQVGKDIRRFDNIERSSFNVVSQDINNY